MKIVLKIVRSIILISASIFFIVNELEVKADENTTTGIEYIMTGKAKYVDLYENIEQQSAQVMEAYGKLTLNGAVNKVSDKENGFEKYAVNNGQVTFSYYYENPELDSEQKQIYKDSNKKIAGIKLDKKAGQGVLILQTSKDGEKWLTEYVKSNLLKEVLVQESEFYSSTDVQLMSGCYYRVIVAYTIQEAEEPSKILFLKKNNYSYISYTEVYEFYLYDSSIQKEDDINAAKQSLGTKTKTESEGYTGTKKIDEDDCHYGWELGNFFVSGYTATTSRADDIPIFLKNQGDKVSLWFELLQDIDQLNGNDALSISNEKTGYDQYFETPETKFGRGTLIIRYTDYENIKHSPEVYTNYLEANAVTGESQRIQALDEGDYEVALDYEIKNEKTKMLAVIPKPSYSHYRIYFKFSVRNEDSNVTLVDLGNGSKLKKNSCTENGFKVELDTTRYLDIDIQRELYDTEKRVFVEDKKLKRIAKSGGEYTKEGIYLVHAKNKYTDSETTKIIYVGADPYLQKCVQKGMTLDEILENSIEVEADDQESVTIENQEKDSENSVKTDDISKKSDKVDSSRWKIIALIAAALVIFVIVLMKCVNKKKK